MPGGPEPWSGQSSTNGSASGPEADGWLLAGSHETTSSPDDAQLYGYWRGTRWPLFKLTLWTGFLTILTLGFYRFWARTRVRRWYWSAIRPGGFPLEYTGTPYEKLLGFLIAVVILAFYIGVINLVLMFVSFSVLAAPGAAYVLTLLGVAPLWFFAVYRAQRYLLARTRWMGIRFGLEPGAWGYAMRACWHWSLTLLTLGMWHPRLRWALAKYRHDRTFYGTQRMAQGGGPAMLYPAFVHVIIGGVLTAGTVLIAGQDVGNFFAALETEDFTGLEEVTPFWRMFFLSVPWLIYGLIHYGVEGRRRLIGALSVGGVALDPQPRVGKILWIAVSGNFLRYFGTVAWIILAALVLVLSAMAAGLGVETFAEEDVLLILERAFNAAPEWLPIALTALFYFLIFLFWNVLTHVFLTMPEWRHYAETMGLKGSGHLHDIGQRARDESREAGGFAEALDVGAAI
ncbi:MAG: DUF898 family protein [Pseudomonadota bacterium]